MNCRETLMICRLEYKKAKKGLKKRKEKEGMGWAFIQDGFDKRSKTSTKIILPDVIPMLLQIYITPYKEILDFELFQFLYRFCILSSSSTCLLTWASWFQ